MLLDVRPWRLIVAIEASYLPLAKVEVQAPKRAD